MATKQTTLRPLAWLSLIAGAVEFVLRALRRTDGSWLSDLAAPYVSARLWARGANPYDSHHFLRTWYASGATSLGFSDAVTNVPSVYPPPTLPFMLPFALLRWHAAVYLFIVCGVLVYGAAVYSLLRLGWPQYKGWREFAGDPIALFFLAFALGFAPAHTAINSENIVLFAASAAILAISILLQRKPLRSASSTQWIVAQWMAGPAVVTSICMKPTTGIFLLIWLLWERRWRLIAVVLAVCAGIAILSLLPLLAQHNLDWLTSYRANVATLFTHGGNADVSQENVERTDHIDLQLVLYAMTGSRSLSSAIAAGVYAAILAFFFKNAGRSGRGSTSLVNEQPGDTPLLVAAGVLALALLPVYSRIYSAIVLLPLALWCFQHLRLRSARWLLLLLCDFLANTSAILRRPDWIQRLAAQSPRLWDSTLGGHTCWLLLAIGLLLVRAIQDQRRDALITLSAEVTEHRLL